MRWLSFEVAGRESFGFLGEDDVLTDVGARCGFPDLKAAIAADALTQLAADVGNDRIPLSDIRYLPTIPNPDKVLCVGLNYRAH
ncbi:MAG: hypothetical protein ACPHE0_05410, partial [Pseudomonadales bacterium]